MKSERGRDDRRTEKGENLSKKTQRGKECVHETKLVLAVRAIDDNVFNMSNLRGKVRKGGE